jgi:hypothetical protein
VGAILKAILIPVATAIVLAALAVATRRGRAFLGEAIRRVQADHRSLHAGPWPVHLPPDADSSGARILILCAPSRSLINSNFDLLGAVEFARTRLGFGGEPAYSSLKDGVRLEKSCGGSFSDYIWVCTNGKLELSVTVSVITDPNGRRCLDVTELLNPLAAVAHAVSSADYRVLYGLPRRAVRMKTDWLIGVSTYSRLEGAAPLPSWSDLVFPEASPLRLVADRLPFCPPTGYAASELQSWEIDRPTPDLLRIFLRSFLLENGYHEVDPAIEQTVAGFRRSPMMGRL